MTISLQTTTKRMVALLAMLALAVTLTTGMTACGSDNDAQPQQDQITSSSESSSSEQSEGQVALAIDTSAIDGGSVENFDIDVVAGDTVLTLLDKAGKSYESEDSSYGMFVTGIDGINNGDQGAMSGWMYTVNGEYADTSADKSEVKAGDSVLWMFSAGEEYEQ